MYQNTDDSAKQSLDLMNILNDYLKHWKWFVLSVLLALIAAYLFVRYSTPEYAAQAKIQILDDKSSTSELSAFKDLDMFSGANGAVEDEIEIIKSRSNLIEVVKKLRVNVRTISLGSIKDSDLYGNSPIAINFIGNDSIFHNAQLDFFIELKDDTSFLYGLNSDGPVKTQSYGKNFSTPIGDIVIVPKSIGGESNKGRKFMISVTPVGKVAQEYQEKINVLLASDNSNILNVSLKNSVQQKAIDIINTLILTYNENAVEDKKAIADKTSDFINDRITHIYSSLSMVDQNVQDLKTTRGITDVASEVNLNLSIGAANRTQLENVNTQLNIASSMKDIVDSQESYEVLPSNVGLSDASIANTTARFNQLVLERKRLLKSSNERNPIIQNLNQELEGLKSSMKSSLNSMTNNLGLQVNNLSRQMSQINSKIYSAPRNETALREITRKQQTTESLYLYLLQKREESQITFASASPKSKIIDYAYKSSEFPVSPKKKIIFLAALLLGLLLPFSLIYANDILDNKIHSMTSLEKIASNIPVLGELPRLSKKEEKLIMKEDRSVMGESLRILRTNLDYLIKTKSTSNHKNNVIFVTSSVPGEGKTFVSTNLSMILASTGKKVLLIGADIRNPKFYTFFTGNEIDKLSKPVRKKVQGLTEYLFRDDVSVNDIINPMLVYNNTIDVVYSGKIPPNPAELLLGKKMNPLFEEVSEMYDYVIVDTAPLMVVTDTLLISNNADHTIYVTRAHVTEEKAIEFPMKLQKEGKIKGLSFVVNDVRDSNLGYGGKYGYGYGETHKKWWKI